ncbi:MAG: DUF2384 domain-containing protein [Sphingomonadaceae bacterium]|nr:DUF2384 domain-containing protein [Sphingomonadaceae bacterium]
MATRIAARASDDERLLTSAISTIADFWRLGNAALGGVLGVSPATASRLRHGQSRLDARSKSFEAAQYLLRLFRGLDALMGSDDDAARRWLGAVNLDLEARPLDLIGSFKGLMRVCDYVDAHRARV